MVASSDQKIYISISGPTGSGKSRLAETLCRNLDLPLINADSVQAYKYLDIGSAKPSSEDLRGITHALYDFIEPFEEWTAPQFLRDLEQLKTQDEFKDRHWVLCGGSGFYLQVAERGVPTLAPSDSELRARLNQRLESEGCHSLYSELKAYDPEAAAKISPNDHYRLLRYLESFLVSNQTQAQRELSQNLKSSLSAQGRFVKFVMNVEREWLEPRLIFRTQQMFNHGLLEEVEALLNKGYESWQPLLSVGYKECVVFLKKQQGQLDMKTAQEAWVKELHSIDDLQKIIVRHSLQLAKKQKTWWKRDSNVVWIPAHNTLEEQYALVVDHLNGDPL